MEEVSSESSKKMKDMDEITSEASWTAGTKEKEKEVWSLEPEGEAEKMARKERENQTKSEKEANQDASQGAEVQSPKRKVIRVKSEETQDHVRDSLNLSQEEAE